MHYVLKAKCTSTFIFDTVSVTQYFILQLFTIYGPLLVFIFYDEILSEGEVWGGSF